MTDDPSPVDAEPEEPSKPNPVVAFLANLILTPLGHLYARAPRRGIVIWLATRVFAVIGVFLVMGIRSPLYLVIAFLVGLIALLAAPWDAYRLARRESSTPGPRSSVRWYVYAGAAVLFFLADDVAREVVRLRVQAFRIPAESMQPTLLVGDYMYVNKMAFVGQAPSRDDVIVFGYPQDPSREYVKRVIGLPGERIELRNKEVLINGAALHEPYVVHIDPSIRPPDIDPRDNFGPYTIPPDNFFVMGDSRDNSNDSRYWGPSPASSSMARRIGSIGHGTANAPPPAGSAWGRV